MAIRKDFKGSLYRSRIALLAGVAMASLPAAALAQNQAPALEPAAAPGPQATPSAGSLSGASEIIVTAQRRAERLENVPATVTYVSPKALERSGVVSLTDLPKVVTGTNVSRTGAFTQPTIRGVGSFITGPGLENNVAIYVDGFYLPTTVANAFDLVDLENVQVLKGPQGSLYGRNATGGAILVTTRDPTTETNLEAHATYARFDDKRFSLAGSTGLGEKAAIGISAYYRDSDGYVRDIVSGKHDAPIKDISIRPKLKLMPTEDFTALLTLEYDNIHDATGLAQTTINGNAVARAIDPTTPIATGPWQTSTNFVPKVVAHVYGAYLRLKYDVGDVNISSYSMYRRENTSFKTDLDGSTLHIFEVYPWDQTQKTMSQELVLSKTGGRFEWIAGAYFYHDNSFLKDFELSGTTNLFSPSQVTTAGAAYVDGTFHLTDSLSLTGGARYSIERKEFKQRLSEDSAPYVDVHHVFHGLTPRATLRYEVARGTNVYASFSQGFKSGLYNTSGADTTPINPEKITAYEVGFKTARGPLRFDTAAFYYDYKNLQTTAYDFTAGGVQKVENAGRAHIKGVEASLTYDVSHALDVRISGTYLHARYSSFTNAQDYCPAVASGTLPTPGSLSCPSGTAVGGNNSYVVDASGQSLSRAPNFTGSAGVDYRLPVASGQLTLSGNLYYSSKVTFSPNGRLTQPGYALVGTRATWDAPGERWSIAVFGDNIFNRKYVAGYFDQQIGDFAFYGPPATYGVTIGFKFK